MPLIKTKLEYVGYATCKTLEQLWVVGRLTSDFWNSASSVPNLVKITVPGVTHWDPKIEIVAVETQADAKCMITVCDDKDKTLGSHIFHYDEGILDDKVEFPLDTTESQYVIPINIANHILKGLNIPIEPTSTEKPKPTISTSDQTRGPVPVPGSVPNLPDTTKPTATTKGTSNVDIPKFEDEYEINDRSQMGRFPGLQNPLLNNNGYGNRDLYPMGQSHLFGSNLEPFEPGQTGNAQGGMIFDPFGGNRDEMFREGPNGRGPGWVPGSKYDDPFGNPCDLGQNRSGNSGMNSRGGPGFPGSGSGFPGSGSGFPGSGSGSGFGFM